MKEHCGYVVTDVDYRASDVVLACCWCGAGVVLAAFSNGVLWRVQVVEAVVGVKKGREGEVSYRLKWQDWGHNHNTWEPLCNIEVPHLLLGLPPTNVDLSLCHLHCRTLV